MMCGFCVERRVDNNEVNMSVFSVNINVICSYTDMQYALQSIFNE